MLLRHQSPWLILAGFALAVLPGEPVAALPPAVAPQDGRPSLELDAENYAAWRDHIAPDADDLAFEKLPWLPTFKDGIVAADQAGKPLLLWVMNGHPLGCT